jgi:hypothetical protein
MGQAMSLNRVYEEAEPYGHQPAQDVEQPCERTTHICFQAR